MVERIVRTVKELGGGLNACDALSGYEDSCTGLNRVKGDGR